MNKKSLLERYAARPQNWWRLPKYNLTIGVAPKCGSTSIYTALRDEEKYRPDEFTGRCIWVAREPVSRFLSLWANKARDGDKLTNSHSKAILKGWSMSQLMDLIEAEEVWNHHWARQVELEGGHATEVIPLFRLNEWWEAEGLPSLPPRKNVSGPLPQIPHDINLRVLKYYRRDVAFYWNALKTYSHGVKKD